MADDKKTFEFRMQLAQIASNAMVSLGMCLGHRLRLFETLASIATEKDPKTSVEIAAKTNYKERYVREWLALMACGQLIEVDESGQKFWIPKERVDALTGPETDFQMPFLQFLPVCGQVYEDIVKVFDQDGPLGMPYSAYDDFHNKMKAITQCMHRKHFITDFMPATGMTEKLSSPGLKVLDVGCGAGFHVCLLAKHYPKSHITGLDLCKDAIELAKVAAKDLPNTDFVASDAAQMPAEWTNKFDYVTLFDALHDQARPDKTIAEMYRVLKPGGVFSLLEVNGSGNVYEDRRKNGGMLTALYGISLFHCLQIASNYEDSLQAGSVYGMKNFGDLAKQAGFVDVQIIETPYYPINALLQCKKKAA